MNVGIISNYDKVRYAVAKLINSARSIGHISVNRSEFFEIYKETSYSRDDQKYVKGISSFEMGLMTHCLNLIAKKQDLPGVENFEFSNTPYKYSFKFTPFSKAISVEKPEKLIDITFAKSLDLVSYEELRPLKIIELEFKRKYDGYVKVSAKNEHGIPVKFSVMASYPNTGEVNFFDLFFDEKPLPIDILAKFSVTKKGNLRCVDSKFV